MFGNLRHLSEASRTRGTSFPTCCCCCYVTASRTYVSFVLLDQAACFHNTKWSDTCFLTLKIALVNLEGRLTPRCEGPTANHPVVIGGLPVCSFAHDAIHSIKSLLQTLKKLEVFSPWNILRDKL